MSAMETAASMARSCISLVWQSEHYSKSRLVGFVELPEPRHEEPIALGLYPWVVPLERLDPLDQLALGKVFDQRRGDPFGPVGLPREVDVTVDREPDPRQASRPQDVVP